MSENLQQSEQHSLSMMYGTYADILFVLFPFLVISMQRLWDGQLYETLLRPDLSIAAAILAGLAIGKFVLGWSVTATWAVSRSVLCSLSH